MGVPGSALATPVTKTFTYGPVAVDGYAVRQEATANVPRPEGAGFITHMSADVVDVEDRQAGPDQPDHAPPHPVHQPRATGPAQAGGVADAFYGDGEERAKLDLPPGYGYPVAADDRWVMVWMLMNHRLEADEVLIRYRVTWDDDPALHAVVPGRLRRVAPALRASSTTCRAAGPRARRTSAP